jgi:RNA polymerase sigma-70 factor (ECF subfamily)
VLSEPSARTLQGRTLDALIAREYSRVVTIASKIVGPNDAPDVAQDVFSDLTGRDSSAITPGWLYVAATHRALNALRTRRRRTERERSDFRLQRSLHTEAPDPADVVVRNDERAIVRAAMAQLDEDAAQILALRYAGLKYREIADALGVNVNQIGMRLMRAERAFRREIERVTS